jgi:hypothetical protein
MRLSAPRALNEPVLWRFSILNQRLHATRSPNRIDGLHGVRRTSPAMRARASLMSATVTAMGRTRLDSLGGPA